MPASGRPAHAIEHGNPAPEAIALLAESFAALQQDPHERRLITLLPQCLAWLARIDAADRDDIRTVLRHITRGQALDVERFGQASGVRALANADELNDYTWLVAGCVGEFWTRLCVEELSGAFTLGTSVPDMLERGMRFGKGLQLVNILRDTGKDAAMGRCYLPLEEIVAAGLTLEEIAADLSKLQPLTEKWGARCFEHLKCGIEYVEALKNRRLKFATALPLLLGLRTLARLRQTPWAQRVKGGKVGRAEVGKVMFEAGIAVWRRDGIRKMADAILSRG